MSVLLSLSLLGSGAFAQSSVPKRQIPSSVLVELTAIESRFDLALAMDCAADQCFSKGCTYVEHKVADRPRRGSLPGLGEGPGPDPVEAQAYLTRARCAFAFEPTVDAEEASAITRRLQAKVSRGWTSVSVTSTALQPLPSELKAAEEAAQVPEPEPEPVAPPEEPWSIGQAVHELWDSLLPHFYWMVGIVLVSFAGTLLIWAWRRVGRETLEERAFLAELERGPEPEPEPEPEAPPEPEVSEEDAQFALDQAALWDERLAAADPGDAELQALIRELLRSGDRALLAKAVLQFPERFLPLFPSGGDIASAKLDLADYLKTADTDELPSDADFFRSLNRHALAASLSIQSDAGMMRSLRQDFGAAGLVSLIGSLPARPGALLFALGPLDEQREMARLLTPSAIGQLAEQLLRSNRMDVSESTFLFEVLQAASEGRALPPAPGLSEVSDRGTTFDAAGALSVLLPGLDSAQSSQLFRSVLRRFQGSLPAWYRGIFTSDMLLKLPGESLVDLLLDVDAEPLAAWLSLQSADVQETVQSRIPNALRATIDGASFFPSRGHQIALATRGRKQLSAGFQAQLERMRVPLEQILAPAEDVG